MKRTQGLDHITKAGRIQRKNLFKNMSSVSQQEARGHVFEGVSDFNSRHAHLPPPRPVEQWRWDRVSEPSLGR